MSIPLEDDYEDIIGKAARGLGIGKAELANRSGVNLGLIASLLEGCVEMKAIRAIAPVLGLDAEKLIISALKQWRPRDRHASGLFQSNTPYHDMLVNAFLLWDGKTKKAAVFDTGTNIAPIIEQISKQKLVVEGIFLTHTHGDHIADLPQLRSETGNPPVYVNRLEPLVETVHIDEGFETSIGGMTIRSLLTSGHSAGGTTFLVGGPACQVAVVGDALFAGSMGGGMVSYADALRNNREKLMTLPDETIVCPGHGPMTTIGEEKQANPFFPEFTVAI
jgi:glyoxylase-like metal-dependent hydrolase (beta-lactamase superfamily II)